ncbi:MAG: nitroreductase family protein [Candidatus Bathyarchaeia archaeon]
MTAKNLLNLILERASVRNFDKNRKVSDAILRKILLAGIRAPSAGNIQPRTFIIVKDEAVKEKLYELCENQAFMKDAPIWIVVCLDLHRHLEASRLTGVDYDFTGILPYTFGVLDAALSLENMVIAAEALGLGSVIIGSIIEHPQKVNEILKLPPHCLALSILCIGYPKAKPLRREKWDYNVIVCENHYKAINVEEVSKYWRKFIATDLKRSGKRPKKEEVEKICRERTYGIAYSTHYTEGFIKATNKKLMEYLTTQGFLKESALTK